MDIKETFTKNLISLRKSANLTQADLAKILNYSDKAISKWERGESIPDIVVLKQIADYFKVTVNELITEHPVNDGFKERKTISLKRNVILGCSAALVLLVAVFSYAFLSILIPGITNKTWLAFIYAIPIILIIALVFASVWKKYLLNLIVISLLGWSVLLAIYLTLINTLYVVPINLWLIFIIGIPFQVLVILWFRYKIIKDAKNENRI